MGEDQSSSVPAGSNPAPAVLQRLVTESNQTMIAQDVKLSQGSGWAVREMTAPQPPLLAQWGKQLLTFAQRILPSSPQPQQNPREDRPSTEIVFARIARFQETVYPKQKK